MKIGIESINCYAGRLYIDVAELFEARGLDMQRFENLMMKEKSIGCPWEDAVTFAVNAAKPIVDALPVEERNSIEMLITASESGVDFGKSLSTYVHDYLGLSRRCRLFEIKQACYGGTAGVQMAASHLMAQAPEGARALVIATDVARATARHSYAEPSQAVASVAMLLSATPNVLEIDRGAYGLCGYEVMDTCRPQPDLETGDADLSLLAYLECLSEAYGDYSEQVADVDLMVDFSHLVFHTPFGGMVKGAHRKLLRDVVKPSVGEIQEDFERRVAPGLRYGARIGNAYSASLYIALMSLIDAGGRQNSSRVGMFSYGSGCASEFYSGVLSRDAERHTGNLAHALDARKRLSISEYDHVVDANETWGFGIQNKKMEIGGFEEIRRELFEGTNLLALDSIDDFHRKYVWA